MMHKMIAMLALPAALALAQDLPVPVFAPPTCETLACDAQNDWMRNDFMFYGVADAMPAEHYGFKPTPEQQSFGERVLHVAQVNVMLLATLGGKAEAPEIDPAATSKDEALAALRAVSAYGNALMKEFSDGNRLTERVAAPWFMGPMASRQSILYFLMMHTQDTYGQLVVYLRLNGIVPPLSRLP